MLFRSTLLGLVAVVACLRGQSGLSLLERGRIGGSQSQTARQFLIDQSGNRFVVGNTDSPDFPTSPSAFRRTQISAEYVRSDDNGRTWTNLSLPEGTTTPPYFRPSPSSRDVYTQNSAGVWRSTDGASPGSWRLINNRESFADLAIHPLDPNQLIAVQGDSVALSTDGGVSWRNWGEGIERVRLGEQPGQWISRVDWFPEAPAWCFARGLFGLYARRTDESEWQRIEAFDTSSRISALAAIGNQAFFLRDGKLYRWDGTRRELTPPQTCGVLAAEATRGKLYCYSPGATGAASSSDGGITWQNEFTGQRVFRIAASANRLVLALPRSYVVNGEAHYFGRDTLEAWAGAGGICAHAGATSDIFVAKWTRTGNLVFSTLVGGFGADIVDAAQVDEEGNLYLLGRSNSLDLEGAYGLALPSDSAYFGFVAKFSPLGGWLGGYSFLGNAAFYGSARPLRLGRDGSVYAVNSLGEVLRFDRDLRQLLYRKQLQGSGPAIIDALEAGPDGSLWIAWYDNQAARLARYTPELEPLESMVLPAGRFIRHIAFDETGRLVTGEWLYRDSSLDPLIQTVVRRWAGAGKSEVVREFNGLPGPGPDRIATLALGREGRVAHTAVEGSLTVWNFDQSAEPQRVAQPRGENAIPAWDGNSLYLATSGRDVIVSEVRPIP